jgi:hypothetical protein
MKQQEIKLKNILNVGFEISQIKDIDLLLEMILGETWAFTKCDAGSIYVKEDECLRFSYAQNDTLQRQLLPGFETEDGGAWGKQGEEIPLFGRIVALADVYDALSCRRCYKEAWDEEEVLNNIREEAGKQFDPELVEVFLDCIDSFRQIEKMYPEQHE